ncbi:polysaccharide biosynthesis protein [Peribacillus cavernae]|uniref:Polysaccharide biosynthesis protein n=1 Tax=Peribacillus cavernae TaxID=1674310 RepID=A0A3S0U7S7_9BACI|nr:polysaccharide biosynthesis protein [Peribacillus cavernae]MDQ0218181.1 stage V sporulation protein B [Peribacillus cavernae]RUQ32674.1 polysaccharide biosynthesis protein [Peribacillus cavernae]
MNAFFRGTTLLIIAAFFSECVEFFVNMILARELGEEGMGLYMSILPIIFLVFIFASLELPISISKFIAENKRELHYSLLQHALKLASFVVLIILILTVIVLAFPTVLNGFHPYVKWLLIGLIPITAFSSIARGYFMGVQQMGKIAFSNFLRKAVQFGVLLLIFDYFHFDQQASLLIALSALIGSELIVFLYLVSLFLIHMQTMRSASNSNMSGKLAREKLLAVSLPTTGLRVFHAITNAIQPFLIQSALMAAGFGAVGATEHFGVLTGVAMTIGFFPAFIAHSLMIMLIPNVSDAYVKKDHEKLRNLLQQSMSLTMIYGIPAVFFMYIFAEPLTSLFFSSPEAALYLKLLCPYFLFHFFVIPMQAYLIGVGLVKDAFYHTVWSHIISFSMMYFLGSQASLHMVGIILGMNTGAVLLSLMHYFTICRKIGITLWFTKQRQSVY